MREIDLLEERLTHSVIGAFYTVHRRLGFGYREHLYALALERELQARGHRVDREVGVMVYYRRRPLARQISKWAFFCTLAESHDSTVIYENRLKHPTSEAVRSSSFCSFSSSFTPFRFQWVPANIGGKGHQ